MNVMDVLTERGFVKQVSHETLTDFLGNNKVSFYVGFDPTADSLHIGHYIPIMAMAHMQRAGHRPIALVGGGTAVVGDPSGRSDMRSMMTMETIRANSERFKTQLSRFLDFSPGQAVMVNNADWLLNLNYVEFLREIGVHFSVNRMLTAECFKSRMEKGLSFLEFNYMLMQGYDFLALYRQYGCRLQLGGDDQWSNILAGADLIRRKEGAEAYALTCSLLLKSDGTKMGKTAGGAVWLDETKTPVFDFYQYWRNVDDADVKNCLSLMTFLPMDEVNRLSALRDSEINEAKKVLAYEVTTLVHGEQKANEARQAAEALFGGGGALDNVPRTEFAPETLADARIVDIMALVGLAKSKGDARRLIQGGGVYAGDVKIDDPDASFVSLLGDGEVMLRKGKKTYHRVIMQK